MLKVQRLKYHTLQQYARAATSTCVPPVQRLMHTLQHVKRQVDVKRTHNCNNTQGEFRLRQDADLPVVVVRLEWQRAEVSAAAERRLAHRHSVRLVIGRVVVQVVHATQ